MNNLSDLINKTNENYFFETFKKFGATDSELITLSETIPDIKEDAINLKLDDKLNIAYIFGIDIEDIIKKPYFLFKPIISLVLKCEIALLEGINPDVRYLDKTRHRHLFANYSARKKGYFPEDYNILIDAQRSSQLLGLGKNKFIEKFYKNRNVSEIHNEFKEKFPDFFAELIKIEEFRQLVTNNDNEKTQDQYKSNPSKIKTQKTNFAYIKRPICYSTNKFHKTKHQTEEISK